MAHVGIDIEQFVTDPYASGIQRVLQYLAIEWPNEEIPATFVAPLAHEFVLLTPAQAAELVGLAFTTRSQADLRIAVRNQLSVFADESRTVREGTLLSLFSSWLLPEVSYLPSVLDRFEIFGRAMPTAMIGFDALPMTEPWNYRFVPGSAHAVNAYFRALVKTDCVIAISSYSRDEIWNRLRRERTLPMLVAHPGGDHIALRKASETRREDEVIRLIRLGTLESRKRPLNILHAHRAIRALGLPVELLFIGNPSASDPHINAEVAQASADAIGVTWLQDASDEEVYAHVAQADVFMSLGTEGFGIPVLEAIRLGTPVVFDGIQPAAQLMQGSGARHIDGQDVATLTTSLTQVIADRTALASEMDPLAVPRWKDFAESVGYASARPTARHL